MVASYDTIIVGAGTSGCVLASRLSADPARKVLVLEAGRRDRDIRVAIPIAARPLWTDPAFNWGYMSEPEPNADNRRIPVPRGKLVGGSSSINGMLYARGHPRDFDQWRQMGCDGWGYEDVLQVYKRLETDWRGETEFHGGHGPIAIAKAANSRELVAPVLESVTAAGLPASDDHNGTTPEGFGPPDYNIDHGRRASAASVFLHPALHRPNLWLITEAQTTRIVMDKDRAVGVEYVKDGKRERVNAHEIILCGGVYNSPQLLMLSGIGPADELRRLGIEITHDLPGVGRNLQDHAGIGVDVACTEPIGFDSQLRADRFLLSLVQWALLRTGVCASMPVVVNGFIRTRPELERPDIQTLITTTSRDARIWFPGWRKGVGHLFATRSTLLHPESRGQVSLASADPLAKPLIYFNLLASETDRASLRAAIRSTRTIFTDGPLRKLTGAELAPGKDVQSDAEIDAYIRRTVTTAFHGVGTCRMGQDAEAVVDPQLRVRGIEGLRVVDCAIMPTITGGNTHAPALMIGEKAAEIMLGE